MYHWRWSNQYLSPRLQRNPTAERQPCVIQVSMPPLAWVSKAARSVVNDWVRARGYELRLRHETQGHILVRTVDPKRDALYVGNYEWEQEVLFLRTFAENGAQQDIRDLFASIERLAMPAFTVLESLDKLTWLLQAMTNLKTFLVVFDELPAMLYTTKGPPGGVSQPRWESEVQPRYELERLGAGLEWPGEEVRIQIASGIDRHEGWEMGCVQGHMMELHMLLMQEELPQTMWNEENGEITMNVAPVTVIRK